MRGRVWPQQIRQLGVRLWPSAGSLRETVQHDGREPARHIGPKHARRLRPLGGDLRHELPQIWRVERRPARARSSSPASMAGQRIPAFCRHRVAAEASRPQSTAVRRLPAPSHTHQASAAKAAAGTSVLKVPPTEPTATA